MTCFEHGLLVIEDSESGATHDDWDAATQYVHLDQGSLYVAVQSIVDGPVEVVVYRDHVQDSEIGGLTEVFSGVVESRLGKLRIHDSDERAVLTALVNRGAVRVTVFVDDVNWASRVTVLVH
ncbi:hypothetical protein E1265_12190 [Streptomyces sp. 8K308]|uniref:hypothetical protein n=1 Tax=Streptomyces sp. 8K308 TaxID=2530388 RepID=UPI00104FBE06|nr:hypothetical protein [Streptomyces sp. 8K308]TDC23613.1 hypothetical protein E1265_12190 [Streptomyces sp. 8K308]